MSDEHPFITDPDAPRIYQIRLASHLGRQWTDWFDGLTITLEENGDTVLTGQVVDQAALHGILKKIRNLGLTLISVNPQQEEKRKKIMNSQNEINPKKTTRMAGFLYLFIAICGGFAFFAGYETLIVAGDATATINNMVSSEFTFRIGMVGDALTFLGEIVLTVLLYNIFKPVNKTLSLVAAYARLAMTAMIGVNMLNKMVALHLVSGADYLSVLATDQLHAMAMLFLNAYGFGSLVWGVFFGLHLAVIGYLILNSTYFPKFLGILFLFASFGYLIDSFGNFLFPQYNAVYTVIVLATVPAELAFAFWLLIKGINVESWEKSMPKFA